VYCFVCLTTRIEREEGEGWTCLRCGEIVKECRPWSGDVLEPPSSRSPSAKAVSFAEGVKDAPSEEDLSKAEAVGKPAEGVEVSAVLVTEQQSDESESTDSEIYEEEEEEIGGDMDE
jgi:peroxin-2